jgi:hypothetical protein
MSPAPAKYPLGLEACVSRHRRTGAGIGQVARACRQRRASRGATIRAPDARKFLFFPRRWPSPWPTRRLVPRSCAALQHPLVNINENTSAAFSAGGRTAREPIELPRENGAHPPVRCNTRAERTSRTTGAIQAATRGGGTWAARRPRRAARGYLRLPPSAIVNRCRSLLIARIRHAAGPSTGPPPAAPRIFDPCKFLFSHARRPHAQALRAPTGGSPRPAPALVNPCRSLLIAQIPGAAEPVRSGDRPVRRHGLSFPPPPPSPREESGERP